MFLGDWDSLLRTLVIGVLAYTGVPQGPNGRKNAEQGGASNHPNVGGM